ncbi:MAG TPA: DUF692 domain-containing protein [Pyrinomonadaceae bacterium]|jgi:hypothetical protein
MQELPKLGVGMGFREIYRAETFLHRAEIDFLEITADHYLDAPPKKLAELDLLAENFALIPHGLNLSLGSAEGIDEKYLEKLAALIEKIQPAWWSEHICFTRANGVDIGHLAPLPFTAEAAETLIRNIEKVKSIVKTPLILENITYNIRFPSSELDEAEFVKIVLEEADCGLLLDVTNLYINSKNHNYDWRVFLDGLPLERIVQLHFVGSHRHENRLIDAHANRTENEIWEVFREVCRRADVKGAILERDENFPPFEEIITELQIARGIFQNGRNSAFFAVV